MTIRQLLVISFLGVSEERDSFLVWNSKVKTAGQIGLSGWLYSLCDLEKGRKSLFLYEMGTIEPTSWGCCESKVTLSFEVILRKA